MSVVSDSVQSIGTAPARSKQYPHITGTVPAITRLEYRVSD